MYANPERAKEWARNKYSERRNEGICVKCGKRYAEAGRSMCKICAANMVESKQRNDPGGLRHYQWFTNRIAERKANGLCVDCGKKLKDLRYSRCKSCRKRRAEYQQVRRIRERIYGHAGR